MGSLIGIVVVALLIVGGIVFYNANRGTNVASNENRAVHPQPQIRYSRCRRSIRRPRSRRLRRLRHLRLQRHSKCSTRQKAPETGGLSCCREIDTRRYENFGLRYCAWVVACCRLAVARHKPIAVRIAASPIFTALGLLLWAAGPVWLSALRGGGLLFAASRLSLFRRHGALSTHSRPTARGFNPGSPRQAAASRRGNEKKDRQALAAAVL